MLRHQGIGFDIVSIDNQTRLNWVAAVGHRCSASSTDFMVGSPQPRIVKNSVFSINFHHLIDKYLLDLREVCASDTTENITEHDWVSFRPLASTGPNLEQGVRTTRWLDSSASLQGKSSNPDAFYSSGYNHIVSVYGNQNGHAESQEDLIRCGHT